MKARLRSLAEQAFHRTPLALRVRAKRRMRPGRIGGLWLVRQLSLVGAVDRGTPLERWYTDAFLSQWRSDVRGRLLVAGVELAGVPGAEAATSVEVVDIDPSNDDATLIADLAEEGSLPDHAYDVVVASSVLEPSDDPGAVCANLWRSVAPGGVLLLTARCGGRLDGGDDRWRLTPAGVAGLLHRACPGAHLEVQAIGNVEVGTAALMGMAAEELAPTVLDEVDDGAPLLVHARAVRPPALSGSRAD